MYPWIHISDSLQLPTYTVIISLVCTGLLFLVGPRARRLGLETSTALDLSMVIMIGGFIGARFLHVLYEHPAFYISNPMQILRVWEGGFVFYGGVMGALFFSAWTFKLKKIEILEPWFDLFAPIVSLGYAIGRLGCFAAGCCYGKSCDLPWAVTFPHGVEAPEGFPVHPTQIYATLFELAVFFVLVVAEKKKVFRLGSGKIFFLWVTLHTTGRLLMEFFRDDFRGSEILGLSVSSFISLLFLFFGILKLLSKEKNVPSTV